MSSAWWLERAGCTVTVLERRQGLGQVTTPNSLGTIRTQYASAALVSLAQESLIFYQAIDSHLGVRHRELGWATRGYAYLTADPTHEVRLKESLEMYASLGVSSSSYLNAGDIARRFPFAGGAQAGIFHADGSWVDPAKITEAWASALDSTEIRLGTAVEGLQKTTPGWEVVTEDHTIAADAVVIAAGPYSISMLEDLGVNVPVKTTPRYRAFIPDGHGDHAAAPLVINIENGSYWRPVPGGIWLSLADVDERSLPPADAVALPHGFIERAANAIESVSPGVAEAARTALSEAPESIGAAGCFQSYPADDAPIIGAVPGHDGLFANVAHWAGVMLSPASGRVLADAVTGVAATIDAVHGFARFEEAVERTSTNKFGGWG